MRTMLLLVIKTTNSGTSKKTGKPYTITQAIAVNNDFDREVALFEGEYTRGDVLRAESSFDGFRETFSNVSVVGHIDLADVLKKAEAVKIK